jgi:hypothetical protein
VPPPKIDYSELKEGYEFPKSSFSLDSSVVRSYIEVVGEDSAFYQNTSFVPPMAIAALAMSALSDLVLFPPGVIHVSQEIEFFNIASVNDLLVSQARVSRKQRRGVLNLMAIEFHIIAKDDTKIMVAKTEFILPEPGVTNNRQE